MDDILVSCLVLFGSDPKIGHSRHWDWQRSIVDDVIIFGFLNSVSPPKPLSITKEKIFISIFLLIHFWSERKAWWWYSKPEGWHCSIDGQICFNIMFWKSQIYKLVLSVFCIVRPPIHKWRTKLRLKCLTILGSLRQWNDRNIEFWLNLYVVGGDTLSYCFKDLKMYEVPWMRGKTFPL